MSGTANRAPPDQERMLTTEEAALRHVALLVARGTPLREIFEAAAEQVARIFGREWVGVMRYDSSDSFVVVATWGDHPFAAGSRWPLDGPSTFESVLRTGRPAAILDYTGLPGTVAEAARKAGIVGGIGAPIVVDGATWGLIAVPTTRTSPIPEGAETRLSVFTELVATAISNAEAHDALALLADEQAALRRVATLVAHESSPAEIFGAVTQEACRVLASEAVGLLRFEPDDSATLVAQSDTPWDPPPLGTRLALDGENFVVQAFRTGRAARVDDWTGSTGSVAGMANVLGVRSAVASPVVVEGRLWGTIIAATSRSEPLPAETESRIEQFTALVATAIANGEARGELSRLAEEQAALRRVAVLVAQQPSPDEVFTAVTEAVGPLVGADLSAMYVFRTDRAATVVASWTGAGPTLPIGTERPLDGDSAVVRIFHTAAPARIDTYADAGGETAALARALRLRSTVGAPILVEGKLWGALMAATRSDEPLPEDAEARVAAFTELVATAVSNAQAREDLQRLADEQAALRRVATLVADGIAPEAVFRAVADEVGTLFGADVSAIVRFEDDGTVTVLGDVGGPHVAGKRVSLDEGYVVHRVRETSGSARFDTDDPSAPEMPSLVQALGIRSSVASPIVVEGELWGAITAASASGPLPSIAERRLTEFTELVASAISNAESRDALATLADEQAALRRIATLVARGVGPEQVFAAVAEETAATFDALTEVLRFEHDPPGSVVVGVSKELAATSPIGTRWGFVEGMASAEVSRSGRSARLGAFDWAAQGGPVAEAAIRSNVSSQVAGPIFVEGTLWGVISLNAAEELPPDTERRLETFAELVSTAIANATTRAELVASRARIVAAGDEARRRIERNLHDGTQQRLIALGLDLQRTRADVPEEERDTHSALLRVERDLEAILEDLRELSHGLHPPLLARLGLGPSLRAVARRSPIPVQLDIDLPVRPAATLETAVYYVVSEAVTNAVKHSHASEISVTIASDDAGVPGAVALDGRKTAGNMQVTIADDGVGGADPSGGSGLTGLIDRVNALGGRFVFDSPPRAGTRISIELPVDPAPVAGVP